VVIGAVIIKHKLNLSDRETVSQIQENPYMQFFIGLESFSSEKPFDASLFVKIRRRMGQPVFEEFTQTIIDELGSLKEESKPSVSKRNDNEPDDQEEDEGKDKADQLTGKDELKQCKLIVDATVADQAIRYPTDVSLLNEAREFSEQIIDYLFKGIIVGALRKKPRTYRQKARCEYLSYAKRRKPGKKLTRKAIKQQLQYLRRNLKHIETLLSQYEEGKPLPVPNWLLRRYWVIQHLMNSKKECMKIE